MSFTKSTLEIWKRLQIGEYHGWQALIDDVQKLEPLIDTMQDDFGKELVRGFVESVRETHHTRDKGRGRAGAILRPLLERELDPLLISAVARKATDLYRLDQEHEKALKAARGSKKPAPTKIA